MNQRTRCVLEKSLLTATARCRHGRSFELGERLGYECQSSACVEQCRDWLDQLREHSRFIFKRGADAGQPLTNHQEIRLQCGGILGLSRLAGGGDGTVSDVSSLLNAMIREYGTLEAIPLQAIVASIAGYDPRPHRKRRKK